MSGGVDSFYALHRHLNRKESNFNLTHLIFCNAGTNGDYGGEEARTLYKKRKELLENIASENNLTLLCVDTNINEFLNQVQERTCTFRTLSTPLAFQKLFRVYYYGSTYSFHDFHFAYSDPSSYDLLNMQSLSTESLTFYSSGGQTTRLGKLKDLADYKLAQDYLNVCVRTLHNCGECLKCKRTLLDLYALGEIDKFTKIFDVNKFKANINKNLLYLIIFRDGVDLMEIYLLLKKQKRIPLWLLLVDNILKVAREIKKKII